MTKRINKRKYERGFFGLPFTTVIGLDIDFPQYSACEAGSLIDYSVSLFALFINKLGYVLLLLPNGISKKINSDYGALEGKSPQGFSSA